MVRREAEFSKDVYNKVVSRNVCEMCGCGPDSRDPWTVHHIIWIEWGLQNSIPHAVLTSLVNARLYHRSCHDHFHNEYDEPPQKDINFVLSQVAIQMKLF